MATVKLLKEELVNEIVNHQSSIEYFSFYSIHCDKVIMYFNIAAGVVGSGGIASLVANKDEMVYKILGTLLLIIGVVVAVVIQHSPYKKRRDQIDIVKSKLIDVRSWIEHEYDKIKITSLDDTKIKGKLITLKNLLNQKINNCDDHWHGVNIPKDHQKSFNKSEIETMKYAQNKFADFKFD